MPFFSGSFYEISNKAEVVMHQSDLILERSALLYERYAPMVFAYLLRRLDAREDAGDVLLEVFTVMLEKRSGLPQDERSLQPMARSSPTTR